MHGQGREHLLVTMFVLFVVLGVFGTIGAIALLHAARVIFP